MGIFHFMGVGRAVGAITCAVDYIEQCLEKRKNNKSNTEIERMFSKSGGINHQESQPGKIEAIVLFTSEEIIYRKLDALPYKGCEQPVKVRDELEKILRKVWKTADKDMGRKLYWCQVDIDNFRDCYEKAMLVARRFSPQKSQGKEIWCNLTGGANTINLALMTMARLTGTSTKHYLITQRKEYQKETFVPKAIDFRPNQDGYFNVIPFLKSYADIGFYEVLLELDSVNQSISSQELLSRVKGRITSLAGLTDDLFKKRYLLKLYGLGYTIYDQDKDEVRISEEGKQFVNDELADFLDIEDVMDDKDIVAESKSWSWFYEQTL